jgi:hypothetical protein
MKETFNCDKSLSRILVLPKGKSGFGINSVNGLKRLPTPAASIRILMSVTALGF